MSSEGVAKASLNSLANGLGVIRVYDACDYIIVRLTEDGAYLNVLKLHKLLYYFQAWNLANERGRLFDENFQAWVHGPVSRQIYDRYAARKAMYSPLTAGDIRDGFEIGAIGADDKAMMDAVLETYAPLTGDQLEQMTHDEEPWIEARRGVASNARSENVISDDTMRRFYASRLN